MSTTESDVAGPTAGSGGLAGRARTLGGHVARLPGVVWVLAIALVTYLIQPDAYPSYDYGFALSTGQDILRERTTAYGLDGVQAPLPHPLTIVAAGVAGAFGIVFGDNVGVWVLVGLALLGFGLLVYATYRLAAELFAWPVGLLAGALVFTSGFIFTIATRTYGDVAAAGLVVYAAVLVARDPRGKGFAPLGVLAVAGLLRPEVWVLSGLLWLWLFRGRDMQTRFGTALVVAAAPVIWMLSDLYLTGDPLHALDDARGFAEDRAREVSLDQAPDLLLRFLERLMTTPIVIAAAVGLVLGLVFLRRRSLLPLLLALITAGTSLALAVAGGTLTYDRFYIVPATMVALFGAVAVLGWTALEERGTTRRIWQVGGLALVALVVISGIDRFDELERKHSRQYVSTSTLGELRSFVQQSELRPYVDAPECDPLRTPGYVLRPYLRYWLDVPPERVSFAFDPRPPVRGTVLVTRDAEFAKWPGPIAKNGRGLRDVWLGDPRFRRTFRPVVESRAFALYASPLCRAAVRARERAAVSTTGG